MNTLQGDSYWNPGRHNSKLENHTTVQFSTSVTVMMVSDAEWDLSTVSDPDEVHEELKGRVIPLHMYLYISTKFYLVSF